MIEIAYFSGSSGNLMMNGIVLPVTSDGGGGQRAASGYDQGQLGGR